MWYYRSVKDDTQVEERLRFYADKLPTCGCPEYTKRIRKEGHAWNHKRIERVYVKLGMNKRRRKVKRRIPNPRKEALLQPLYENITWSADFMYDRLESGRMVRILNVIDDYNREALLCEPGFGFSSQRVVEHFQRLIECHGKPASIRTDNGTEFLAGSFVQFCLEHSIRHIRIQKGKPMQNGYIERLNRAIRSAVLDAYLFENMEQLREQLEIWKEDYNENHPHSSLMDCTPKEFKQMRSA